MYFAVFARNTLGLLLELIHGFPSDLFGNTTDGVFASIIVLLSMRMNLLQHFRRVNTCLNCCAEQRSWIRYIAFSEMMLV